MAIAQMDLSAGGALSQRAADIASMIELKFDGGAARGTLDVIKADLPNVLVKSPLSNILWDGILE